MHLFSLNLLFPFQHMYIWGIIYSTSLSSLFSVFLLRHPDTVSSLSARPPPAKKEEAKKRMMCPLPFFLLISTDVGDNRRRKRKTENNTEKKKRKGLFATCVVSLSQLRLDNDFFSASRRPIFCVIFPGRVAIARCDLKKIGKKFVLFFWCWCRNIGDRKSFSQIPNAKSGSKQTYCLPRECPAENDPRLPRPHFLIFSSFPPSFCLSASSLYTSSASSSASFAPMGDLMFVPPLPAMAAPKNERKTSSPALMRKERFAD